MSKPGVDLVQQRHLRSQDRHLEDLRSLLLATGKIVVHRALQEPGHVELLGRLGDPPFDLVLAHPRLGRRLGDELAELDPGNLDGVLEALHQTEPGSLVDVEAEQLGTGQGGTANHLVAVAAAEDMAESRLARSHWAPSGHGPRQTAARVRSP